MKSTSSIVRDHATVVTCLLLLMGWQVQAQPLREHIDTAARTFMQDSRRVGLTIGVVHQGKIYTAYYGSLQRGTTQRPGPETTFEIGSVSKTFAGTLLAQAILDGKLSLDTDVRSLLYQDYPNLAYADKPILVRHLVTHMSGLPAFLPDQTEAFRHDPDSIPFILSKAFAFNSRAQFLRDLHGVNLDTVPGENYRYSNPNAQLAGILLENVYQLSYDALVKKYITGPAGMKHTFTDRSSHIQQLATGYSGSGKAMPYVPGAFAPAGGIYSTPADMLQYLRFQLDSNHELAQRAQQVVWGDPKKTPWACFGG